MRSLLRFLPLAACLAMANAAPVKIALIGDSITQGSGYAVNGSTFSQNGNRSWRWEFFKRLVDAGAEFDFVGSLSTNFTNSTASDDVTNAAYPSWRGVAFDRDHEGHWGWRASQIRGTTAGPSSGKRGTGDLTTWLGSYTPDTVVLMIGINDLNDPGQTPATLAADVSALIDLLQADNPAVRIHLCELLHVGPGHANQLALNTAVDLYNGNHLPAIATAESNATSTVSVVPMANPSWDGSAWIDQPGGWSPTAMTYDQVHPNSRGEAHVAARVANAFGLVSPWTPVAIDNGNFESGFLQSGTATCRPSGWTIIGTPNSGAIPKGLTDYSVVAESSADTGTGTPGSSYIIAGPANTGIAQTLAETVQAGRDYQLQLSLYKASSAAVPGDYSAELRANGVTLATIPLTEALLMYTVGTGTQLGNSLKEFTASFTANDVPSALGQPIEIRLMARNNARYIGFEDVRLSWRNEIPVPEDETLKIFVLTGQSNSLGTLGTTDVGMRHGAIGSHPAEQAGGVPFYWDNRSDGTAAGDTALGKSAGWTVLGAQTGGVYAGNDNHWGPEIGFARMLWNAGYRHFAIVKASRGGGGNTFWQKNSTDDHMYDHLVATVNAAVANLPTGYSSHRIAGLFYVQGESNDSTEAGAAGTRFSDLLVNLKTDLPRSASLSGVFGEIAGSGTNRNTTRAAQLALANSRADIGYAKSTGLMVHNQDGLSVHYDAESQVLLGERVAAEFIAQGAFATTPLPAWPNVYAWFVADNGVTFDSANAVNRWADLHHGGAVRDLSRRVAGQTFRHPVTAGNGQSRQVMRFDGTNDLWANATTEFGTLSGARSVAILCRVTGSADGFLFDGTTGTGKTRAQVRAGQWQAGVTTSAAAWNAADTNTVPRQTGVWQQHVFTFLPNGGGTTVAHWIDGALVQTLADAQSADLGGLILGSNGGSPFSRLAADIAEVAVFNTALGATEIAALGAAWDARWGTIGRVPFAASVLQSPREIARFGRHELLEVKIDNDGATTLTELSVQLAAGTRASIDRIALVSEATGNTLALIEAPATDALVFSTSAPLLEGSNRFAIAIEPKRHAALGTTLDAAVTDLTFAGSQAGPFVPSNANPAGVLRLGLVPLFTDVVKSGDLGINTFRIPGIVSDANGVMHAVYDHRYDNSADLPANVDVGYSRSTDGGATWSTSRVIMDFDKTVAGSSSNGVGDPCLLRDPATGTLWVAALWSFGNHGYSGSGAGTLPTDTGQYVLTKSDDGGDTWSAPINVTAAVKDDPNWTLIFQGPGHGLALRNGTLVFPSQYRDSSGTVRVCSVFSSDHGATWDFGSGLPTASPQTNENTVCELDDGRLLYSMRTPSGSNGQRAWIRYTPGGATPMRNGTWDTLFRLPSVPDAVCQGSVIQWTSTHRGDPREFVLFGNPASSSSRTNFTLRVSPDGGSSWPVSRQLYAGSAAYSSICILPDRSVGVLFEKDDYTKITFARVEEAWLFNPAVDADNDGMPDAWELLHGLNPSLNDAGLDSDNDGTLNRDEFAAGTDPRQALSVLRIRGFSNEGDLEWSSVPGRSYAIEESGDLVAWETVEGFETVLAEGASSSVSVPVDASLSRFFRVRVLP